MICQPQVSVVIPTYNRANFLSRSIGSALRQSLPICEVLVTDDGSTDNTLPVLRDIARKEPRVRILQQENGGANKARNAGIEAAKSDWIAFLDSDDYWEEEKLEKQFEAMAGEPDIVAAFTGTRQHFANRTKTYLPKDDPTLFDLRCNNELSSTSTCVASRKALLKVGGFDPELPSCQDWDLWLRLRRVGRFRVVREPLTNLDAGTHERITLDRAKVRAGHQLMFRRVLSDVTDRGARRRIMAKHTLILAEQERCSGNFSQAIAYCARSLVRSPSLWGLRCLLQSCARSA